MTSHRSHGCRPQAKLHNRVYVRTYVGCQSSATEPTFFGCIHIYIYVCICIHTLAERSVASNRAPLDAISDCRAHSSIRRPILSRLRFERSVVCAPPFQRLFGIRFVNDTCISYVVPSKHFFEFTFSFFSF